MSKQNVPATGSTVDRQSFHAERDRLAGQVAALEKQLSDVSLTAAELSSLPAEIAAKQSSLNVIEARLSAFLLEDAENEVATLTAEKVALQKKLAELQPYLEKYTVWQQAHDNLMAGWLANPGDVEKLVKLYAEILPGERDRRNVYASFRDALEQINEAKEALTVLQAKEARAVGRRARA